MPEAVLMTDCGDGKRRADMGSGFRGLKSNSKTADYTLKVEDSGKWFDTVGAGAAVTFTTPASTSIKPGMWYGFSKLSAQDLKIQGGTGVKINNGTAAKLYKNVTTTELAASVLLMAVNSTNFVVRGEKGTWTNDNS